MGHAAGGYTGPSEEQLLEVALQRVQKHVIEAVSVYLLWSIYDSMTLSAEFCLRFSNH